MTQQTQETTFTVYDHTTMINTAGVILIGYPNGWGARFEPKAAIAHALYLLAHREELEQLQQRLEQTWREVALEIKECFETDDKDGTLFSEATAQDIQRVIESVAGVDKKGYFVDEPTSRAGRWYRTMWNEDGSESTTFEQQWTPFLRVCHQMQVQEEGMRGNDYQ